MTLISSEYLTFLDQVAETTEPCDCLLPLVLRISFPELSLIQAKEIFDVWIEDYNSSISKSHYD